MTELPSGYQWGDEVAPDSAPVATLPHGFAWGDEVQPETPKEKTPGILSTAGQAAVRGAVESGKDIAAVAHPFDDQTQPTPPATDYLSKILAQPLSEGWKDPNWWAAHIAHGAGASAPSMAIGTAGALAGAGAGSLVGPEAIPIGGLIGGATGFGAGSAMQELAPAYQRARADGLDHDAAVDRAMKEAGIAGAFGAAMGAAPAATGFIKKPISEALAQMFVVQPGLGAAQQVTENAVEGKPTTAGQLATGYAENAGMGAVLTGAHAVARAVTPKAQESPPAATPAEAPKGGPAFPLEPHYDPATKTQTIKDANGTIVTDPNGAPIAYPDANTAAQAAQKANDIVQTQAMSKDAANVIQAAQPIQESQTAVPGLTPTDETAAVPPEEKKTSLEVETSKEEESIKPAPDAVPEDASLEYQNSAHFPILSQDGATWGVASEKGLVVPGGLKLGEAEAEADRRNAMVEPANEPVPEQPKPAEIQPPEPATASPGDALKSAFKAYSEDPSDANLEAYHAAETAWKAAQPKVQGQTPAPAAPATPPTGNYKPLELLQWISKNGGISDPTGELKAMDANSKPVPGHGVLAREDGKDPDYVREAAIEAGYLPENASIDDLHEAIRSSLAGTKNFSEQDRPQVERIEQNKQQAAIKKQNQGFTEQINSYDTENNLGLSPSIKERSLELMQSGYPTEDAVHTAIEEDAIYGEHEYTQTAREHQDIPFDETHPEVASTAAELARERAEEPNSGTTGTGEEVGRSSGEGSTEKDGQTVIPGAEVTDKDRLDVMADKKLQGGNEPLDDGLFGDGHKQQTLFMKSGSGDDFMTRRNAQLAAEEERETQEMLALHNLHRVAFARADKGIQEAEHPDEALHSEFNTNRVKNAKTITDIWPSDVSAAKTWAARAAAKKFLTLDPRMQDSILKSMRGSEEKLFGGKYDADMPVPRKNAVVLRERELERAHYNDLRAKVGLLPYDFRPEGAEESGWEWHTNSYYNPENPHRVPTSEDVIQMAALNKALEKYNGDTAFMRRDQEPVFYSTLTRTVENYKGEKAPASQWLGIIKNAAGVKQEERDWSGVEDWLRAQNGSVSKADLLDYLKAHEVQLGEVTKGSRHRLSGKELDELYDLNWRHNFSDFDEARPLTPEEEERRLELNRLDNGQTDSTQYFKYTLPGGKNYREMLMTLPPKNAGKWEVFNSVDGKPIAVFDTEAEAAAHAKELSASKAGIFDYGMPGDKEDNNTYKSPHWEEPNVLAHIRFDDRTGPNGEKILHVGEIQSDMHQAGRRYGYSQKIKPQRFAHDLDTAFASQLKDYSDAMNTARTGEEINAALKKGEDLGAQITAEAQKLGLPINYKIYDSSNGWQVREQQYRNGYNIGQIVRGTGDTPGHALENFFNSSWKTEGEVPDAPFKTTWPELAMKRMIRYAAENGYDKLTWDTGDTNAERYDLSKHVDKLMAEKNTDGTYDLHVGLKNGGDQIKRNLTPKDIVDNVGKDPAEKIIANADEYAEKNKAYRDSRRGHPENGLTEEDLDKLRNERDNLPQGISGLDLKVGGEGMKGFYDKILPATVDKLAKKWGAKTEDSTLDLSQTRDVPWNETPEETERNDHPPVHSLTITPEMRQSVMQGQPLFQKTGLESDRPQNWEKINKYLEGVDLTPEEKSQAGDLINRMNQALDRIAPTAQREALKSLRTADTHDPVEGAMSPTTMGNIIRWATDAKSPEETIRHEAMHFLRREGLITPDEWMTLEKAAKDNNWLDKHKIDKNYGDLTPDQKTEEAIAAEFQSWRKSDQRNSWPKPIYDLFHKIWTFAGRMVNAVKDTFGAPDTAARVFDRIDRGEVGNRDLEEVRNNLSPDEERTYYQVQKDSEPKGPLKYPAIAAKHVGDMINDSIAGRLVRRVIAPGIYDANAMKAAQNYRQVMGDMYLREMAVRHAFKDMVDYLDGADKETKEKFAVAADTGNYAGLDDREKGFAEQLKSLTDESTKRLQTLGVLKDAQENYLGRIWKPRDQEGSDAEKQKKVLAALQRPQPLTGPKSFLKERYYDTWEDARKAGLEPVWDNPVVAHLQKLSEMNKFYAGTILARSIKGSGIAKFYSRGSAIPDGFLKLEGPEFTRDAMIIKNADGTKMSMPEGNWYAPEGYARVMNNIVSRGLEATPFREATNFYRDVGNRLNQMQLGFSAFHPIATSIEGQISRVGIGIDQAMRGQVGKGLYNIAAGMSPSNWVTNFKDGDKFIKAVLAPQDAPEEMHRLIDAFGAANGRIWMDRMFRSTDEGNFNLMKKNAWTQAWQQASSKYPDSPVKRAFNVAFRALDSTMGPVMDYIVPRQKMGVFSRMMGDWIEANPTAGDVEFTQAAQKLWDSVDNRLGEMVYDNIFWHKMMKDLSFLTVRSVGWNMGTLREIGGGVVDGTKNLGRALTGQEAEWTHRMSYLIALPIVTGMYGAMYQYLSTGKGPDEPKDLFFPRTGYKLPDGAPERVSIPSYMRDVYAWSIQPSNTAINKMHPMTSMVAQAINGEDYYGDIIANKDDPVVKQIEDVMSWMGKSILPFSFSGGNKMHDHPWVQRRLANLGIQPSPGYISDPEKMERYNQRQHKLAVAKKNKHESLREHPVALQKDDDDDEEDE